MVGLLICSVSSAPASSATRHPSHVGGWNTGAAILTPGTAVGSRIRVTSGGRSWARRVLLQYRSSGGAWRVLQRASTGRDGRVSMRAVAPATGRMRVVVPPTRRAQRRVTPARHVTVTVHAARRRAALLTSAVVQKVNALRRHGTYCGGRWRKPVPALRTSARLAAAAHTYARRMAALRFFGHADKVTGAGPGWRATNAGYSWSVVGENLAADYPTARAVVRAWRRSPAHCRNMMDGRWKHIGVGWYDAGPLAPYGNYWGQLFGKP